MSPDGYFSRARPLLKLSGIHATTGSYITMDWKRVRLSIDVQLTKRGNRTAKLLNQNPRQDDSYWPRTSVLQIQDRSGRESPRRLRMALPTLTRLAVGLRQEDTRTVFFSFVSVPLYFMLLYLHGATNLSRTQRHHDMRLYDWEVRPRLQIGPSCPGLMPSTRKQDNLYQKTHAHAPSVPQLPCA